MDRPRLTVDRLASHLAAFWWLVRQERRDIVVTLTLVPGKFWQLTKPGEVCPFADDPDARVVASTILVGYSADDIKRIAGDMLATVQPEGGM